MTHAPPPLPPEIEGRLLAHRRLIVALMGGLPDAQREAILDRAAARAVFQDGQEDPGAVPVEGLALEYALADEFKHIARLLDAPLPEPGD